jgi:hypothetical protein
MLTCRKCKKELPPEKFGIVYKTLATGERKGYRQTACMVCWRNSYLSREGKRDIHREGSKNWYYNNPEKAKEQRLRKYKISLEEYNLMRLQQEYKCAICERSEQEVEQGRAKSTETALQVDHCHTTGAVRGLLCTNCNTMLGKSKDNVGVLQKAIEYLRDKETAL